MDSSSRGQRVYVGVFLHDVTKFQLKDGLFNVDMEYWVKWRGDFTPARLRIANSAELVREPMPRESDGDWHSQRWRVRGTLRGTFPVHSFPLDQQTLEVVFELPQADGRVVPDLASSGMARQFSITDWHYRPEFRPVVQRRVYGSDLGRLAHEGKPAVAHRVAFQIHLQRPILTTVLKLFLPLCIVGLVAFIGLFLHPDLIDARSAIGITALLSCFAFQFTIAESLPEVAYLTLADMLFLIAYLFSSVVLIQIVISYNFYRRGRASLALITDRWVRRLLPAVTLLATWLVLPAAKVIPPESPAPLPKMSRLESRRDVVRIGSNVSFSSLLSLASNQGIRWELTEDGPDGEPRPVLVERIPGVSNRAMRFLAGGRLEVHWRLRRGLRWSDGRPVTVRDLLLPREVYRNEHIAAYRELDRRTMAITWTAPLAQSLEAPAIWPAHSLGQLVHQAADSRKAYSKVIKRMRTHPLPSLGPYRIVRFEPGKRLVAEANPHFVGPPPSIKRVEEVRYASRAALVAAFKRGEVDITIPNGVTFTDAVALRRERPEAVHIVPSNILVALSPDLSHPLLKQLTVRRALLMALDREALARAIYGTAGRVAHVPVPGPLPPGTVVTPHDPARARALLQQAGAVSATTAVGGSHRPGGRPRGAAIAARGQLRLPLYMRGSSMDRKLAQLMGQQLAAVGVILEPKRVKSTYKLHRKGKHGGLVLWVTVGQRSKNPLAFWNVPLRRGNYVAGARNAAYTDEVRALVERDLHAIYPERRRQLRDALFARFSAQLPVLPVVFAAQRILADPSLRGWNNDAEHYFGTGLARWHFATQAAAAQRP